MPVKKIVVVFLVILVAISGFLVGLYLLREQQDLREQAAVTGGQATVSISPSSGDFEVGDTITAEVSFNTSGIDVSGIAIRLFYPFTGITPEVSVISVQIDEGFLLSSNWSCPTRNAFQQGGNVFIDIACANLNASGFSSTSDVRFATIEMRVNRAPSANPVILRFDPQESAIRRRSDNADILLIPQSQGTYLVKSASEPTATLTPTTTNTPTPTTTNTPTPTEVVMTNTATPTIPVTIISTRTPTPTKTDTPTPLVTENREQTSTPTKAQLPDAGVSMPTILGVILGILVVIGAIVLAL